MNFRKSLGQQVFKTFKCNIRFNLLHVCPSAPFFCICLVLYTFRAVLYIVAVPGGPWYLSFALGPLENLSWFIQIIHWAPLILQVQSTGLPSIFFRTEPWLSIVYFHVAVPMFHYVAVNLRRGKWLNNI